MSTMTDQTQEKILPDEWTMILRPKRSLLDSNLRELWQCPGKPDDPGRGDFQDRGHRDRGLFLDSEDLLQS